MSTQNKKINWGAQIAALRKSVGRSTNHPAQKERRVTVQVRISKHIHAELKTAAARCGKTISKLLDEIVQENVDKYQD
ncbi:MAG: hypothetical protein A3J67_03025 [Parcubacteria group bacterium RIFCSPHIGHO2_02_FULL_48_10b]|nr:MAG: hypothetical protein A3J67_03025 [Parcubacteria group bacterium RIFCSPHIGHO2_02_FULL_48_10b]